MTDIEYVLISDNIESIRALAADTSSWWCFDDRADAGTSPFRALVRLSEQHYAATTLPDDVTGVYRIHAREIKAGYMKVVSLHPMIRHPARTHEESDTHWYRQHGPLALVHHPAMSQYVQLSVDEVISGPHYDGFALCGFDNVDDLRQRFFAGPTSIDVIREDVAKFSDTKRSPRRLIATVAAPPA